MMRGEFKEQGCYLGTILKDLTLLMRWNWWVRFDLNLVLKGSDRFLHLVFKWWRWSRDDWLVCKTSGRPEERAPSEERGCDYWLYPSVLRVWEKFQTRAWACSFSLLRRPVTDCSWLLLLHLEDITLRLWSTNFQIILHSKWIQHMWSFLSNKTRSHLHYKNHRYWHLGFCWLKSQAFDEYGQHLKFDFNNQILRIQAWR